MLREMVFVLGLSIGLMLVAPAMVLAQGRAGAGLTCDACGGAGRAEREDGRYNRQPHNRKLFRRTEN